MIDADKRFEDLKCRFREEGYRLTPQRVRLLELLSVSDGHPSAAQLHERMMEHFPTTSLATVYKTLTILKDMDEVLELGFSDDDNRYDGHRPFPHPHLVCVSCHRVSDLDVSRVARLEDEVHRRSGYEITSHRLDFYGICPECQRVGQIEATGQR